MAPTKTAKKPPTVKKAASPTNAAAAERTLPQAPSAAGTGSGGGVDLSSVSPATAERVQNQSNAAEAKAGTAVTHPNAGTVRKTTPTSAKTGTKSPVSSNGGVDISNGQLSTLASDISKLQNNDPTTDADLYAAGEAAQKAADAAAAGSTPGAGTTSTTATTTSTSLLSKITGFFSTTTGKVVIVGGIGVAGFVVYRRLKAKGV